MLARDIEHKDDISGEEGVFKTIREADLRRLSMMMVPGGRSRTESGSEAPSRSSSISSIAELGSWLSWKGFGNDSHDESDRGSVSEHTSSNSHSPSPNLHQFSSLELSPIKGDESSPSRGVFSSISGLFGSVLRSGDSVEDKPVQDHEDVKLEM